MAAPSGLSAPLLDYAPAVKATSVVTVLLCGAVLGCGEETPARAIYALAEDVEHEVVDGTCERLFPSTLLPARIAAALKIPEVKRRGTGGWDREQERCRREFGRRGEFESFEFHEPLVRSVEPVEIAEQDGITAAARARVALDGAPPTTVPLVEFRGKWRVVFTVR
jgi:hypothetical protein